MECRVKPGNDGELVPKSPRRTEAALSASRGGKLGRDVNAHWLDPRDDKLGNAVAAPDDEGLIAEIDHDDLHLAAIIGIDGSGAVQKRHAGFERKTGAGPKLALVSRRQFQHEASLDSSAASG